MCGRSPTYPMGFILAPIVGSELLINLGSWVRLSSSRSLCICLNRKLNKYNLVDDGDTCRIAQMDCRREF
jgi:hypothetical protein